MVYLIVVGMCVNKPNLDNNKHFPLFPNTKGTHIVFFLKGAEFFLTENTQINSDFGLGGVGVSQKTQQLLL